MFAEAFLRLARTSSADGITVMNVAKESGLTRRTFYRHFAGMDDLACYSMEMLGRAFASGLPKNAGGAPERFARAIFEFWENNLALLNGIRACRNAGTLLLAWMRGAGGGMHGIDPKALEDNSAARYLSYFMMGGVAVTLVEWAADTNRPSAAAMARIISLPLKERLP